jgi:hypothetical protein
MKETRMVFLHRQALRARTRPSIRLLSKATLVEGPALLFRYIESLIED